MKKIFNKEPLVLGLVYHDISDDIRPNLHTVSSEMLHRQLSDLKNRGYEFVRVDEFFENREDQKTALITFDDAYKSVITNAIPVLDDFNVPGVFYVNSATVEEKRFWRDKVRFLIENNYVEVFLSFASEKDESFTKISSGNFYRDSKDPKLISSKKVELFINEFLSLNNYEMKVDEVYLERSDLKEYKNLTFGNHTASHYVLSSLEESDLVDEIESCENFLKSCGISISSTLSIPFGGRGTYNDNVIRIAQDLGYRNFLTVASEKSIGNNEVFRMMPENKPVIF